MGRTADKAAKAVIAKKHLEDAQAIEKETNIASLEAKRGAVTMRKRERRLINRKINRLKVAAEIALADALAAEAAIDAAIPQPSQGELDCPTCDNAECTCEKLPEVDLAQDLRPGE